MSADNLRKFLADTSKVQSAINFYANFPMDGFRIVETFDLKTLDLKASLEQLLRDDFLYGEIFPPIYFDGEKPPKRVGFSGEEI